VLEFYDIKDSKWASLGYESLFFLGFFFFAWLVREPPLQDMHCMCHERTLQKLLLWLV
jgi:hypothetical protein